MHSEISIRKLYANKFVVVYLYFKDGLVILPEKLKLIRPTNFPNSFHHNM